jgi:hypothetical protein
VSDEPKPLSPEEMGYAGVVLGDASRGEMTAFDGETECSDCMRVMPEGETIYWRGSQGEEDAYCTACARRGAESTRMYCEHLEAEHKAGRLP